MTTVVPAVLMIFLIVFGAVFIHCTVKGDKLDSAARDKSSEIDGSLWDRGFQLSKLVEILESKNIEHEIDAPDVNTFGLGMSPVLQATTCETLDSKDKELRRVLKKHPELMDDEEFKTHLDKFNNARNELFKESLEFNKSVNVFNSYISRFPSSVVARFHKKREKNIFMYYFVEIKDDEETEEKADTQG